MPDDARLSGWIRFVACGLGSAYMWASLEGTMSLSSPTSARPVARSLFSPFSVSGSSVVPVCRPFSDHSVSPWRIMKARGVVIVGVNVVGMRGENNEEERRGKGIELINSVFQ